MRRVPRQARTRLLRSHRRGSARVARPGKGLRRHLGDAAAGTSAELPVRARMIADQVGIFARYLVRLARLAGRLRVGARLPCSGPWGHLL
jgi:hypothetical protein